MESNSPVSVFVPSTWKRLAARSLDSLFEMLMYAPFLKTLFLLIFDEGPLYMSLSVFLLILLLPAIYEGVSLWLMQATPGKWLLGLKVVPQANPDVELHWTQCVLRALVERASLFFSWAIFATAFFRYDRTHVADWVAETRVVQFVPRPQRAKLRWFLGLVLVFLCASEGLRGASGIIRAIDWQERRIDLRALYENEAGDGVRDLQIEIEGADED
ncbi:MAG: RDD family protein [Bdellovibrio sp.]|nr:RDD family protein [Bdellovibrio sp.]